MKWRRCVIAKSAIICAQSMPASTVVRTVRSELAPGELGPCDAHEHLFFETPLQPDDGFTDVDKAIEEAGTLVRAGARTLVDWTPIGLGRAPEGLLAVAEVTGLHVVAATGFHRDAHYEGDHWVREASAEELVDLMVRELTEGMDGTSIRAGVIKVGASYHVVTPLEQRVFEAAAAAHTVTGAPLCVHTEHGTLGLGIVERLETLGVRAEHVVLAHLDRNPDPGEHAETAAAGAWLQFDGPSRVKYHPDSTILALISALAERGFADHLLLGGDTGRRSSMRAYGGGPGLDYVFARFKPRLERELGQELSDCIFVTNPARAFALRPSPTKPSYGVDPVLLTP
jgi:5-phospho-D-xylono-1,4-lactonase